jgi:hypothetical protein
MMHFNAKGACAPMCQNIISRGVCFTKITVTNLKEWLNERQLMTNGPRQHLHRANNCMKHFADGK